MIERFTLENKNLVKAFPVDRINRITVYSTEYDGVKNKIVWLDNNYGLEVEYWVDDWNGNDKRLASFYMSVNKKYSEKLKEDFEKIRWEIDGEWIVVEEERENDLSIYRVWECRREDRR